MKAVGYQAILATADDNALLDIEVEKPAAQGHDLLVEVRAVSANPVDSKIRSSVPPPQDGYGVLGWDASGVVVEVGDRVTLFKPGDEVWYAGAVNRPGCHSEFHLVDERIVAHKPRSLSHGDAAALPLTSLTAWEVLFDRLQLHNTPEMPQRLLITGGAGGVGSVMIQLARALTAAEIIATASRDETAQWVRDLGANHVLNHRNSLLEEMSVAGVPSITHVASLTHTDNHFDELVKMLAPQGRLALIDTPSKPLDIMAMKKKSLSLHWEFMFTRSLFSTDDMIRQHHILNRVADLVDRGAVKSTARQRFGTINAENLLRAQRLLESNASIGKIVLEGFG